MLRLTPLSDEVDNPIDSWILDSSFTLSVSVNQSYDTAVDSEPVAFTFTRNPQSLVNLADGNLS